MPILFGDESLNIKWVYGTLTFTKRGRWVHAIASRLTSLFDEVTKREKNVDVEYKILNELRMKNVDRKRVNFFALMKLHLRFVWSRARGSNIAKLQKKGGAISGTNSKFIGIALAKFISF